MPVMAFRAVMGNTGSNTWREYVYALCVCAGVAVFTMADQAKSSQARAHHRHSQAHSQPANSQPPLADSCPRRIQVTAHVIGLLMLTGSVCADAIAPNLQVRALRRSVALCAATRVDAHVTLWKHRRNGC